MDDKSTASMKAVILVLVVVIFALIIWQEEYNIISKFIRYYSNTITIISLGSVVNLLVYRFASEKTESNKRKLMPHGFLLILAIIIITAAGISNTW